MGTSETHSSASDYNGNMTNTMHQFVNFVHFILFAFKTEMVEARLKLEVKRNSEGKKIWDSVTVFYSVSVSMSVS